MKLKQFLFGSVSLSIATPQPEKLLNACSAAGFDIISFRRIDEERSYLRLWTRDFMRLRPIARGRGARIRVLRRHGASRHLLPLIRRPVFICGAAIFLLFCLIASNYIAQIRVVYSGADDRELLTVLDGFGLRVGAKKSEINENMLKEQALTKLGNLSWIGIFIRGGTAEISSRPRRQAPEIIPRGEPCSITALKTGVLRKLNVFRGNPLTEEGKTVMAGETIVSAEVPVGESGLMLVHSLANVEARTWYELTAYTAGEESVKTYTGRSAEVYELQIFKYRLKFAFGCRLEGDNCDIIIEKVSDSGSWPLSLERTTYSEYTLEPAKADTEVFLRGVLTEVLSASLHEGRIVASEYDAVSAYEAGMRAECVEKIGVESPYVPSAAEKKK